MRLCAAVILLVTLSAACGLKCYTCVYTGAHACLRTSTCPAALDQCFSLNVTGYMTKGCRKGISCVKPIRCCDKDLCNTAAPTGPGVVLLLVSSAVTSIFL